MYTFLFGELRRWGGRQFLNQVFFDRTGNVTWMLVTYDYAFQQPPQTFFTTRQPT